MKKEDFKLRCIFVIEFEAASQGISLPMFLAHMLVPSSQEYPLGVSTCHFKSKAMTTASLGPNLLDKM
jgi:hypothetical protein